MRCKISLSCLLCGNFHVSNVSAADDIVMLGFLDIFGNGNDLTQQKNYVNIAFHSPSETLAEAMKDAVQQAEQVQLVARIVITVIHQIHSPFVSGAGCLHYKASLLSIRLRQLQMYLA